MRIRKILTVGVVMMAMLMAETACGSKGDRTQIAKEALESKYNEEFEVTEVYDNNDRWEAFNAIAYSETNPEILVYARVENDGSYVADNYLSKIMGAKIADVVDGNMGGLLGAGYIYVSSLSEDMGISDLSISISDYAQFNPRNKFTISIYYSPEENNAEYVYDRLAGCLKGLEMLNGYIFLHVIDEKNLHSIQEYIETHAFYEQDDYRQYLDNELKIQIGYSDGKIDMTRDEFIRKAGNAI